MSAPDPKTFVVKLTHPTGYFLDIVALWVAAPIQEKWVNTPNFTEAANYVSSGPFMMKSWTHQAEIVLGPEPELVRHEADPDHHPLRDRWRSHREPGLVRGG